MLRWLALVVAVLFVAGCGGGTSNTSQISTNAAVSAAENVTPTAITSSNTPAAILANSQPLPTDPNVVALTVDSGPDGKGVNRLYTTVTICKPGSQTQCQTIDHVLVDTGSVGLRLLASAVPAGLQLSTLKNTSGNNLLACANFLDGSFAWGPMAVADVKLGEMVATSTPVQLVGDPVYRSFDTACSSSPDAIVTPKDLGANGILGVGLFKQDCGSLCELQGRRSARNGKYFACTNAACTAVAGTTLSADKQLQQVIALFPTDNNGFAITMDSVSADGAVSASGLMVFGLGTRSNNQFSNMVVLPSSSQGYIRSSVAFNNDQSATTFGSSFLDTGSNGIYFDGPVAACTGVSASFYCPASTMNLTAVLGASGASTRTINFSIANADKLFTASAKAALPSLSGSLGLTGGFDWGLPAFYGRTVLFGIDGKRTSGLTQTAITGPFYAL